MRKIKLVAVLFVFGIVGVVLSNSQNFTSHAEGDPILEEIAGYKQWNKITSDPIKIGMDAAVFG